MYTLNNRVHEFLSISHTLELCMIQYNKKTSIYNIRIKYKLYIIRNI